MKSKILPALLALLLTSASCGFFQKEIPLSLEQKNLAEYDQFIADFENNYIYLDQNSALFDCLKKTYREKASTIPNTWEHVKFYETLLHELHDSHIHLNTNTGESYRLNAPIYAQTVLGKTSIINVWQTQLQDSLKVNIIGAEIISINEIPFQKALDDFPTVCQNKKEKEIRNWVTNKVLAGKRNEPRLLKLKLETGKLVDFNLDDIKIKQEDYFLRSRVIADSIGYIRINNTLGNKELVDEIDRVMKDLYFTKALILDLRNTVDGGDTETALPIMGLFVSSKEPYQLYENQKGQYHGYVKPRTPIYTKPLYILVNRWTGSMGEGMAIGFDGIGRATIIGTEMERLAGGMKSIPFKYHDYSFSVSIEKTLHLNGSPREEFVPDEYVQQNQLERDEVLDYALELINER
jgi:C-terminal processing protease CtpA/Prc